MRELPTPDIEARRDDVAALGSGLKRLLDDARTDRAIRRLLGGRRVHRGALGGVSKELLEEMVRHQIAEVADEDVELRLQVRRVDEHVLVTDRPDRSRSDPSYLDSLWEAPFLSRLLVRGQAASALDVGCGCGVFSLAAARYCDEVVGVDINPRAVVMGRFNASLNRVENVAFVRSDLFEAVRGRRFDRIVFNSPTGFELREHSLLHAGEAILERFFAEMSTHLADDGYVQVNLCFKDRKESSFRARLATWLAADATGLQMVLLEHLRLNRLFAGLLVGLLGAVSDRRYGFDVTALVKGWLTLRRGPPVSLRVALDYHRLSRSFTAEVGNALLRSLLDERRPDLPATPRLEPRDWAC